VGYWSGNHIISIWVRSAPNKIRREGKREKKERERKKRKGGEKKRRELCPPVPIPFSCVEYLPNALIAGGGARARASAHEKRRATWLHPWRRPRARPRRACPTPRARRRPRMTAAAAVRQVAAAVCRARVSRRRALVVGYARAMADAWPRVLPRRGRGADLA
jgi:hypothetical protein